MAASSFTESPPKRRTSLVEFRSPARAPLFVPIASQVVLVLVPPLCPHDGLSRCRRSRRGSESEPSALAHNQVPLLPQDPSPQALPAPVIHSRFEWPCAQGEWGRCSGPSPSGRGAAAIVAGTAVRVPVVHSHVCLYACSECESARWAAAVRVCFGTSETLHADASAHQSGMWDGKRVPKLPSQRAVSSMNAAVPRASAAVLVPTCNDAGDVEAEPHVSRGHSVRANTVGFGTFLGFRVLLVECAKITSNFVLLGGGMCILF